MKKYIIMMLLCLGTLCFGGTISTVKEGKNYISFVFTGEQKSKYEINYDAYNRLVFIEFLDSNMSSMVVDNNFTSNYVEMFKTVKYSKSTGFFIKLKKNVSYSTKYVGKNFQISFVNSNKKQYTIAIDPGHGGKDSGAVGFGKYYEKVVVLEVSKYLRDELKKDFNVIMTRDTDIFIPLGERPRKANNAKADLYISIHANSAVSDKLNGVEVFYFSKKSSPYAERIAAFENSVGDKYGEKSGNIVQIMGELAYKKNQENSISFAKETVNALSSAIGLRNRGIHGANFAVLRGFNGPGVLIEIGFINNKEDLRKIWDKNNQKKMAKEIAKTVRANFY